MLISQISRSTHAAAAVLLAFTLMGCATTRPDVAIASEPEARVFYPAEPDPPRLQFLTSYRNPQVWDAKRQSTLATWITGHGDRNAPLDQFVSPYGIAMRNGRMYVCDVGNGRVHLVDFNGKRYTTLGEPGVLLKPVNLTIAADGTLYVCDTARAKVFVFDAQDRLVRHIDGPADWEPMGAAILGDELFVVDAANCQIVVFNREGSMLRTISQRGLGPEQLRMPSNIAAGTDGQIYVTDGFHQTVKVFDIQGRFTGTIGIRGTRPGQFARPKGIAIDGHGHIYVADALKQDIQVFDSQGRLLLVFGEPGDQRHSTGMPAGLYIDRTSIPYFRQYLDPNFEPEYLLFVVNQFGYNKVAVYAFGAARNQVVQSD